MKEILETEKFYWIGGRLCLDFINTKLALADGTPHDLLANLNDFAAWAAKSGLTTTAEASKMAGEFAAKNEAREMIGKTREFREIVREVVLNLERDEPISPSSMEKINAHLAAGRGVARIIRTDEGNYEKRFSAEYFLPLDLLAPLAEDAADLICYTPSGRIKNCENPACVLHFYDATRNRSRRWCSMQICGNRAKAAAFYKRNKQKTDSNDS